MSHFSCWFGKRLLVVGFLFSMLAASAVADDELKVGDLIEFDFMGDTRQAKITKFTGTGWPYVEFEYHGKMKERFFPASRVRLVQSASAGGDADVMPTESREWVDSTGKYKIQGKLISNENGTIEIEKSDGRVIKLPIAKLSAKDEAHLKEAAAQSSPDNPFAGGTVKSPSRGSSGRNATPGVPAAVPASITAITPAATAGEQVLQARSWNYQPTPAPAMTASSRTIALPKSSSSSRHSFHNRSSGAHISLDKKLFATTIGNAFESSSDIVVVDLEKGIASPAKRIAIKQAAMLGVSPDGSYAATRRSGRGSSKGAVDFWRIDGTLKHVAAWATGGSRGNFSPNQGRFIDTTKLLTVGKRLVLWDIKSATAIYSAEVNAAVKPAFSPDGKVVAVGVGTMIHLVEIESGSSLGQFVPPPHGTVLAFSQSGRFLAGTSATALPIWVWDLQNNELAQELSGPRGSSMQWLGDKYLLVNESLIDVQLRVPIWKYATGGGSVVDSQDGRQWFVGKNKLVPVSLPHKDFDAETADLDPDSLLVFKPGAKVAFDFQLPFPPAEQKKIRDTLAGMLQKSQVAVDQSGSLRLVAKVTKQKQESSTLSDFFSGPFGRGGKVVTYTPHAASLSLERDGQVLWSKKTRYSPGGMISIKQGESGQQAVNRACQPSSSFFSSAVLPKYLARLPGGKPLGTSTINDSGVN